VESVELTGAISPGATKVFIFKVDAPHENGNYLFQWLSHQTAFVGDYYQRRDVVVNRTCPQVYCVELYAR
jgi:hypothetical protein